LIDPAQMGTLFKVLAIAPRGAVVPPGFEGTGAGGDP
jgi:SAM-dependent MidA family methyltransferase